MKEIIAMNTEGQLRSGDLVKLDIVQLTPAENFTIAQRSQLQVVAE